MIIRSQERNSGKWPLGVIKKLIMGSDRVVRAGRLHTGKSQFERAMQHLYPLHISCNKTVPTQVALKPNAATFRPRRDAAVAGGLHIKEIA